MDNYGVDAEFYCAELSFDVVYAFRKDLAVYKPLPRFPSVTRDIAVLCDSEVPVGRLHECIMSAGGNYLKECELFDVYTGERIPSGKKSVAFSLTMRADDQTLTDDHAGETVDMILKALSEKFGAVIR
jgi:phenylalanyl-tRNA synthetase beta chain